MEKRNGPYLEVTIHQFKGNISRYMRALEDEKYKAILLFRKDEMIGAVHGYQALRNRANGKKSATKTDRGGPDGSSGSTEV